MTLYVPTAFGAPDPAAIAALVRGHPFATLITPSDGGEPFISHLPLLWDESPGPHGVLVGHLAAANVHAQRLAEVDSVAIFQGPHCYVSPSWYREPARRVPTWNYAALHAHGRAEILDDAGKIACIDRLTSLFEQGLRRPWQRTIEGEALMAMLRGIVAFRVPIVKLEAKFKMSQNRDADDRAGVIRGLRAQGGHDEAQVAGWMQAHEPI